MFDYAFPLVFVAFAGFIVWSVFARRGREKALGGRITWSAKAVPVKANDFGNHTLNIHSVTTESGNNVVGMECRQIAKLGVSVSSVTFTDEEAKLLAEALMEATKHGKPKN